MANTNFPPGGGGGGSQSLDDVIKTAGGGTVDNDVDVPAADPLIFRDAGGAFTPVQIIKTEVAGAGFAQPAFRVVVPFAQDLAYVASSSDGISNSALHPNGILFEPNSGAFYLIGPRVVTGAGDGQSLFIVGGGGSGSGNFGGDLSIFAGSASSGATPGKLNLGTANTRQIDVGAATAIVQLIGNNVQAISDSQLATDVNHTAGIQIDDGLGTVSAVRIKSVDGDPNGKVTADQGSIAIDVSGPALYQNTDGATAWSAVGGVVGPSGGTADGDSAVFADTTGDVIRAVKNNQATADPDENDDNTQGYEISSRWINTTSDEEFVCVDASTGAAAWENTTRAVISGIGAYIFDSSIVSGDPGSGEVRFNNATPADVTRLFISGTTGAGFSATDTLGKLSIGDQIFFRNAFNGTQSALFRVVTTAIDNGSWFDIEVTPEPANFAFADGDLLATEILKVAQFPPSSFGSWDFTIAADAFIAAGFFGPGGNGSFGNDPSGWQSVSFHVDRQDGSDMSDYLLSLGSGAHIAVYDSTQNDPVPIMLRCIGVASSPVASVISVPVAYYDVTGSGPQILTSNRTYRMVSWPAPVQASKSFQTTHSGTFNALSVPGTGQNFLTFTPALGPNDTALGKILATFTTPYAPQDRGYRIDGSGIVSRVLINFTGVNGATWAASIVRIRKTLGSAAITVTQIGSLSFLAAGAGTWEQISVNTSASPTAQLIDGDEIGVQIGQLSGAVPNFFRCTFDVDIVRT